MVGAMIIVLAVAALYLGAVSCRNGHPGLREFRGWAYAHRGLHGEGRPENSMAAFRASLEGGYGIEFDLHLLKDGNLAVIHDSKLKRTTGVEGRIEDLTTEDLKNYHLEGTEETIPTFRELLDLYAGKAPLIVELKPVGNNHGALCKAACDMLESYEGPYCMESFDPRCVMWLKRNRPKIIRGQLAEDFVKRQEASLDPAVLAETYAAERLYSAGFCGLQICRPETQSQCVAVPKAVWRPGCQLDNPEPGRIRHCGKGRLAADF